MLATGAFNAGVVLKRTFFDALIWKVSHVAGLRTVVTGFLTKRFDCSVIARHDRQGIEATARRLRSKRNFIFHVLRQPGPGRCGDCRRGCAALGVVCIALGLMAGWP